MMWRVDRETLVRETWEALDRGDFTAIETAFAPGAKWRAVEDGPWNCESRAQIVETMRENRAAGALRGAVAEVRDIGGDRALVGFRPEGELPGGWPLDEGIRYVVLTFDAAGLVTEMKGCRDRATAFEYAGTAGDSTG
jgi:hypothetical protein